jgi:hypothetical protein
MEAVGFSEMRHHIPKDCDMCGYCCLGFIPFSKFIYGVQCSLGLLFTPLQCPLILFGLEILITAVWPTFFFHDYDFEQFLPKYSL